MQSFQSFITELFDSQVKPKWAITKHDSATTYNVSFKVGKLNYSLTIDEFDTIGHASLDDVNGEPVIKNPRGQSADINFFQETETRYVSNITGTGHAFEVFGKVINILDSWFHTYPKPRYVTYEAKEASRIRLYRKLTTQLIQIGYKLIKEVDGQFILQYTK